MEMMRITFTLVIAAAMAIAHPAWAGSKDNSLSIALSEPIEGVAEIFAPNDEAQLAGRAVFDRLLSVNTANGKVLPLLATSWKQVDDKTWDFTLRTDVKFHDGTPFTADDLVYTLNWTSDPNVKFRLKNRFTWIEKAEKLGPSSVRVRTNDPFAVTLLSLGIQVPILPAVYHAKFANKPDFDWQPIGTGPYKAVSVDRNAGLTLAANENYVQANTFFPKPSIQRVTIKSIPDEQARMAQMMVDSLELTRVVSTDIGAAMKTDPRFAATTVNGLQYFFFLLDAADRSGIGVFKDARVRHAIAHAIDRDAIRKQIVPGGDNAFSLDQLCVPVQVACTSTVKLPAYDPAKARALLKEAGLEKGFAFEIVSLDRSRPVAEAISGYLSRVGIRASINNVTLGVMAKIRSENKMNALVFIYGSGGIPDTGSVLNYHFTNEQQDFTRNDRLHEIAKRSETLLDDTARAKLIGEALDLNNREMFVLPVSGAPQAFVFAKGLTIPQVTLSGYGLLLNQLTWK